MMRLLLVLSAAVLLAGCDMLKQNPDDKKFNGTYKWTGVECISTSGNVSASADAATTTSETFKIEDEVGVAYNVDSSCTVTYNETIKINVNLTVATVSSGTFSVTNRAVTTSTGSSCNQSFGLTNMTGGTITPSSYSVNSAHNSTATDLSGDFFFESDSETLALESSFTVSGSPSDKCYVMYEKQ